MTLNDLYQKGCLFLNDNNIENAEFDARCLVEHAFSITTTQFFIKRSEPADETLSDKYYSCLQRRISGEPLQYILGKWEFMGNEFYVGDGVLIPRPETEQLVSVAAEFLKGKKHPVIFDLCSGTGCIAISIAKLFPDSKVYAVEKYDKAYDYLLKNIRLNSALNVEAVNGDLFNSELLEGITPDIIVSNPPYIRTEDIQTLDITVQKEPHTALDGGIDGYEYYRFLADYWFAKRLNGDSAMVLECGEDQGDSIASMLSVFTDDVTVYNDFNDLQRIVFAKK